METEAIEPVSTESSSEPENLSSEPSNGDVVPLSPKPDSEPSTEPNEAPREAATTDSDTKENVEPNASSQENPNLLKLKIDGVEQEYDISNRDQLIKDLQLSKAANQRFQEAQQTQAQIQQFAEEFKTNPVAVMQKLGMNPREISEAFLQSEYEREDLSPEEQELLTLRQEKEAWEANQNQQQQIAEQQYREQQIAQQREKITTDIVAALDSSALPKNEQVLSLMANCMSQGHSAQESVPMVQQYLSELINHFVSGISDGSKLQSLLGNETLNRIRKYHVQKVQSNLEPTQPENTSSKPKEEPEITTADIKQQLGL